MRRICEEEKLRGIFSDGLPHSVSEVGKRFKLSVPVAYNELRRLKALVALNRPGIYVLPKVRRTDNAGFFKVGGCCFLFRRKFASGFGSSGFGKFLWNEREGY